MAKAKIGGSMHGVGGAGVGSNSGKSSNQSVFISVEDITGKDSIEYFKSRTEGSPTDIEFITDTSSGTLMTVPSRKWRQMPNYVNGISSTTTLGSPRIMWTALTKDTSDDMTKCVGSGVRYITDNITNKKQLMLDPAGVAALNTGSTSYAGPRWSIPRNPKLVAAPDKTGTTPTAPASGTTPTESADDFSTAYIAQESICQDLWWSIETQSLTKNEKVTPFYLDISLNQPNSSKQPTFLAIRIGNLTDAASGGLFSPQDIIDIVFNNGQPGILYDRSIMMPEVMAPDASGPPSQMPAQAQLVGQLTWDGKPNRIGFFPVAGRLCISVNGSDYVYTRLDQGSSAYAAPGAPAPADTSTPTGKAIPIFMNYGTVRVIGTNSQAIMGIESMYFSAVATMHLPMPGGLDVNTGKATKYLAGSVSGTAAQPNEGDKLVSVMNLPGGLTDPKKPDAKYSVLGVFARKTHEKQTVTHVKSGGGSTQYSDATQSLDQDLTTLENLDPWGKTAAPLMHGEVELLLEPDMDGASATGNMHYAVRMTTDANGGGTSPTGYYLGETTGGEAAAPVAWPILPPVFFRARGVSVSSKSLPEARPPIDVSGDIMEINESIACSDRHIVTHTLDMTLYNENGKYDNICEYSVPVQVGLQWSTAGTSVNTFLFTGVTLSSSRSLVPGKETVSVHCEDYMYLLGATTLINSPYYDGMDGFAVFTDLAMRAGIANIIDHTTGATGQRYFLPSGYSFTEPAKRYDPKSSLKDCISDVCTLGAKVAYFDENGSLVYDNAQGSQDYNDSGSVVIDREYFSDPASVQSSISSGTTPVPGAPGGGFVTTEGIGDSQIILDEKREETKLNSTSNRILIKSIDRTTGAIIMMGDEAPKGGKLTYWKTIFASDPSLGSYQAVSDQMGRWKKLFYKPVRGISIKVADDVPIIPMSFISVDGRSYRVMSVNRTLSTSDNSITTQITGEWMGSN